MAQIFCIEIDTLWCVEKNVSKTFCRKSVRKSGKMHILQLEMQQLLGPQTNAN